MSDDKIRKEVALLSAASRQELAARWQVLFGAPPPPQPNKSELADSAPLPVGSLAKSGAYSTPLISSTQAGLTQ
jgi:hypothetical protein